jgi:hypothetical protein
MLNAVWVASGAAQILLLLRAIQLRKTWPAWTAWVSVALMQSGVLAGVRYLNPSETLYFWAWAVTEIVILSLLTATTVEVYRCRAERRVEVGRVGVAILAVSLIVGMLWALATGLGGQANWEDWLLQTVFRIRSSVVFTFGAAALAVLLLYAAYPCPTPPQVIRHHRVLTGYLVWMTAGAWLASITSRENRVLTQTIAMAGNGVIYLLWAWWMEPIPPQPPPARGEAADQLDAEQIRLSSLITQATAAKPTATQ